MALFAVTSLISSCQAKPKPLLTLKDPTDAQSILLAATDIALTYQGEPAPSQYHYYKNLTDILQPLAEKSCGGLENWDTVDNATAGFKHIQFMKTHYGDFLISSSAEQPFNLYRYALRLTDNACSILTRKSDNDPSPSIAGKPVSSAVLFAVDALAFPEPYDPTKNFDYPDKEQRFRAIGVLSVFTTEVDLTDPDDSPPAQPSQPAPEPETPLVDLGFGIKLRLGEALEKFKNEHTDASCVTTSDSISCEIPFASSSDCPGEAQCNDPTYSFKNEKVTSVTADYDAVRWSSLLAAAAKKFGQPKWRRTPNIGNMSSAWSYWELRSGELSFVQFSGTDVYGNALKHPYVISFGSDRTAEQLQAADAKPVNESELDRN